MPQLETILASSRSRAIRGAAATLPPYPRVQLSRIMVPKNWIITSRRACPVCGASMQYRPTWLKWLTGQYRRVCTRCGYTDPVKVKL